MFTNKISQIKINCNRREGEGGRSYKTGTVALTALGKKLSRSLDVLAEMTRKRLPEGRGSKRG